MNAGEVTREVRRAISAGDGHQESFDPPVYDFRMQHGRRLTPCREVSLDAKISVSVHYRKTLRGVVTISLSPREVLYEASEEDGQQCRSICFADLAVL